MSIVKEAEFDYSKIFVVEILSPGDSFQEKTKIEALTRLA
jgi:hypothetical protein